MEMDAILTQWAFHRVQEHLNQNSDEEFMTFRSWRSHMNRQPYPASLPNQHHPARLPNVLQMEMDAILTQWYFHRVQEHLNRNSDEKFMTFRSWRSHMTRQPYPASLLTCPNAPFRPTPAPTALQRHLAGNLTQWAFHRVQEHPNRSSDEEVMTFQSWRSCMILAGRNPSEVNPSGAG